MAAGSGRTPTAACHARCGELDPMGQRSKTHHFLPQMILRGFAMDDRLTTVELGDGRSYQQPVAKAADENKLNNTVELDGGTQSDVAERFIAEEIESPAAAVLALIAAGGWFFDAAERASVARFLTLQYLRVPWRRAQSNAMADWLMKLDLAAGGPNQLRRVMEKRTGHPVTDQDVAEVWASLRDFDDWKLALSREHHVTNSLRMVDEFAPGVAGIYEWAVMRWEHKRISLVTRRCCWSDIATPSNGKGWACSPPGASGSRSIVVRLSSLCRVGRSAGSKAVSSRLQPPPLAA